MHLLQQNVSQPTLLDREYFPIAWPKSFEAQFLFHDPPVFHVHEVPLQHLWQELAIEALLAFHCKSGNKCQQSIPEKGIITYRGPCQDLCMPLLLCSR